MIWDLLNRFKIWLSTLGMPGLFTHGLLRADGIIQEPTEEPEEPEENPKKTTRLPSSVVLRDWNEWEEECKKHKQNLRFAARHFPDGFTYSWVTDGKNFKVEKANYGWMLVLEWSESGHHRHLHVQEIESQRNFSIDMKDRELARILLNEVAEWLSS